MGSRYLLGAVKEEEREEGGREEGEKEKGFSYNGMVATNNGVFRECRSVDPSIMPWCYSVAPFLSLPSLPSLLPLRRWCIYFVSFTPSYIRGSRKTWAEPI